ncbi:PilZ domain-containing protein [Desulfovibrio subterraneus]|uniref:PilZ domain-containing protein n=1 Tax=Desulfovibrio subterraneus TaxID=2718620 RepID=A0A7J0BIV7_9BACT|nr:PilZ domain-containing protein [Desulfovibrio subterraneus]GFM33181.1 hypothetical protein DSM101010T_15460 [Desulfovibrio subterraneus]
MKTINYTYKISNEIGRRLECAAEEMGIASQELLDGIVDQFLYYRELSKTHGSDQRAFNRMHLSLPAMIYMKDTNGTHGKYQAATIRDISHIGLGLSCKDTAFGGTLRNSNSDTLDFEVFFSIGEDRLPLRFNCKAKRIDALGDELHVGAIFEMTDLDSKERLRSLLEKGGPVEAMLLNTPEQNDQP